MKTFKRLQTLEAHQTRFACKTFDSSKTIEKEDLEFILEVARLSPSSVGLEPWKFMVVQSKTLREKLKPICWIQSQITDASELIVILSRTKENLFEQGYIKKHYEARGYSPDFYNTYIKSQPDINEWTKKQCYIALANIMSSAQMMGIDSCPIEGFDDAQKIAEVLSVDTSAFDVAVLVALGTRAMDITPKKRLDFDAMVEYV